MAKGTIRFSDCEAEFRRLCAEIDAGRFAPVYLLMGEEPYFIDALCERIASTVLTEAERSFDQIVLYGRDSDGGTVASYCRQMPMAGNREVIIVKEAQRLDKLEKLASYTSAPLASTVLVICHKEKNADKRLQLYKSCKANGVVFESVRPRDYEIKGWLGGFVRAKGLEIAPSSVELLVSHIGTDISRIDNELTKLTVSLPAGTKRITDDDIQQYIGISKEFNNLELCKAVTERDVKRALEIADRLSQNPKEYPLLLTVSALFGSFREIFIVNYLTWQSRRRGAAFPPDSELLGMVKAGSPAMLQRLKAVAAKWDNRKVFGVLGLLREYDAKSKGVDSGGASDGELLRELLLKIFTL